MPKEIDICGTIRESKRTIVNKTAILE